LKVWREVENLQSDEPPPDMDVSEAVRDPDTGHMISSVVAAALCIKPRGLLTDRQAGKVNALLSGGRQPKPGEDKSDPGCEHQPQFVAEQKRAGTDPEHGLQILDARRNAGRNDRERNEWPTAFTIDG
jgi:hypothetical protein